jgi:post-segregation antitoxin (ccd killing protein)
VHWRGCGWDIPAVNRGGTLGAYRPDGTSLPKVSVYLPDELYRRAREERLPVSAITQAAIEEALRARDADAWVARVKARSPRPAPRLETSRLLDEVREEFGA